MIESVVRKLREMEFSFNTFYYNFPDVFASDYPVRRYMERAHEAERKLEGFDKYLKAIETMPEEVQQQIKAEVEKLATKNPIQTDFESSLSDDRYRGFDI